MSLGLVVFSIWIFGFLLLHGISRQSFPEHLDKRSISAQVHSQTPVFIVTLFFIGIEKCYGYV